MLAYTAVLWIVQLDLTTQQGELEILKFTSILIRFCGGKKKHYFCMGEKMLISCLVLSYTIEICSHFTGFRIKAFPRLCSCVRENWNFHTPIHSLIDSSNCNAIFHPVSFGQNVYSDIVLLQAHAIKLFRERSWLEKINSDNFMLVLWCVPGGATAWLQVLGLSG